MSVDSQEDSHHREHTCLKEKVQQRPSAPDQGEWNQRDHGNAMSL